MTPHSHLYDERLTLRHRPVVAWPVVLVAPPQGGQELPAVDVQGRRGLARVAAARAEVVGLKDEKKLCRGSVGQQASIINQARFVAGKGGGKEFD